jgi:hypothetical protein
MWVRRPFHMLEESLRALGGVPVNSVGGMWMPASATL